MTACMHDTAAHMCCKWLIGLHQQGYVSEEDSLRMNQEEEMHSLTNRHSHKTEGLYDMQTTAMATELVHDVIRLMLVAFNTKIHYWYEPYLLLGGGEPLHALLPKT